MQQLINCITAVTPNIYILLRILATLLATTCTNKCSFSTIGRFKFHFKEISHVTWFLHDFYVQSDFVIL